MKNFYRVRDAIPSADLTRLGGNRQKIMAILTGEKRQPKANEWFLSGAEPEAYRATNDLTMEYHIVKLVQVEEVKFLVIVKQ